MTRKTDFSQTSEALCRNSGPRCRGNDSERSKGSVRGNTKKVGTLYRCKSVNKTKQTKTTTTKGT